MTRIFILFITLLSYQFAIPQSTGNLKENKHIYLHGNSVLIGNTILGHHTTKPMMDDNIPNDAVKMKYIDVDQDRKTFSSSQASLIDAPKNARVAYAALYWGALYPHKKSSISTRGGKVRFMGKGERDSDVNQILFQMPGKEYISIEGKILKDEHGNKDFSNVSPYVCRADVTNLLQDLPHINGIYTVANIKATEGTISGGGSAGWILYVVYEDFSESLKYFTTYDGLIQVDRETVDLKFSNFKSNQKGKINPTLGIAALEGDRKIRTDQMLLYSPKKDEFIPMSNRLRSERNFFNSSITMGNQIYENRNPNSSNTLGFDVLKLDVPNESNQFFDENTTETTLRFQTKADRFFLFFVSFEIDMDREYLESLNSGLTVLDKKSNETQSTLSPILNEQHYTDKTDQEEPKIPIGKETKSENKNPVNSDSVTATVTSKTNQTKAKEQEVDHHLSSDKKAKTRYQSPKPTDVEGEISIRNGFRKVRYLNLSEAEKASLKEEIEAQENTVILDIPAGYYLVTNVFAIPDNATRWRKFLVDKGFKPSTFLNPENNWEYIYINSFDNLDDGFEAWLNQQDKNYFIGLWLMKVNLESNEISGVF